jgi:hypothetical protein
VFQYLDQETSKSCTILDARDNPLLITVMGSVRLLLGFFLVSSVAFPVILLFFLLFVSFDLHPLVHWIGGCGPY